MASKVTIYHNPRCTKSRQTLALLNEQGADVEVIEYLKEPPDEATLTKLVKQLKLASPRELIRSKEYKALDLPETDDPAELIRRMAENPQIIERPIVVHGKQARLGRPPENVLELF